MTRILAKPASQLRHFQQSLKKKSIISSSTDQVDVLWSRQILDPNSDIVNRWNYVFLLTCLISLFIDPLYFYLPFVSNKACMSTDDEAASQITIYRSLTDLFYVLHILMKFRTAFVNPNSRVFGRGELVMDPREIAKQYLKNDFLLDLMAALPLPQIVILYVIPATKKTGSGHSKVTLALIVLIQYVPRLFVIFPLNQQIIKTTGFIAKTAWAGAAYNLLLFMLASHVAGASWYVTSIARQYSCWSNECRKERDAVPPCVPEFLDCSSFTDSYVRDYWRNSTQVLAKCDAINDEDSGFKFGIFADAFTNEVASSSFMEKYLYCLWWGLRNLSSYGQNLNTSTYIGETLFSISISIIGLVLFAQLIGNMQTYLQSMTVKIEEWRIRKRDIEEWMRHRQLPEDLQERVRRFDQCKWLATRGVNEEEILQSLPLDLRRQIQRHLCLNLVRRVPFFEQMDDQLLDAICERLVSSLSIMGTYVVREGDPVNEMFFIIRGQLESSTTNGGRSGFFNSTTLRPGDFCGEELLTWALLPNSTQLPSSTRTVRALSEVEAFALRAEDLKFFAVQFKRLHSKKLQHAFRYYSYQWRTWGACFIQAAWRRYRKKKMENELALQESYYYMQDPDGGGNYDEQSYEAFDDVGLEQQPLVDSGRSSQQLGATILAKRFAANTRRGLEQKIQTADSSSSLKMPKLFKPDEPDFSTD
ncbi:cyclic nucleotide-gated ion channel 18 isoform X1 [Lycium ferocissimum]|uniref:cyclic nucleotide-gated ion channel 18 isoform X1 n=1 Tax=Lycium ferocissimum TaxID=112874 RepID=UPI0028168C28|nr:cyclic nucleotide-gated ion channel 18 isoform X1 [Lycium ferocissimum]XP_059294113.1 cyclic nucleotide-gated ion channel 18 isoform X1 [Lycium ferocissimum]XP_059294114.1 cyclic nucleotide-gated ion channel 18 isoform X1 [Lycium ferocissimum]XP_059294115.1 cyclic nucleotide-gated ion channel 18 isoform X1 [Lycium ferocissimum]XP_059294116.1 cyclic nucleotide-gated ion channel 18 isoform X1 [Lycium ferocissimum]